MKSPQGFAGHTIILLLTTLFLPQINPFPETAKTPAKDSKKPPNKWECFNTSITTSPAANSIADPILPEWGGNCTQKDWDKCSHLKTWTTSYLKDRKHPEKGYTMHEIDCVAENWKCLCNGWTVTRCQLLCMRCNRDVLTKYDKYVTKEGPC